MLWVFGACRSGAYAAVSAPVVTLESVDNASCLPVLQIPGRPSFGVTATALGGGAMRVVIRQLPDAYPAPHFSVGVVGGSVRVTHVVSSEVEGGASCDVTLRVGGVPAGSYAFVVDRQNPDGHSFTLGRTTVTVR